MKALNMITTELSVFREGDNFDFGESVTKIRVEDMGSGPVIVLKQDTDDKGLQEIWLDMDELEKVFMAAKTLKEAFYYDRAQS